jgi:hypothetical protein
LKSANSFDVIVKNTFTVTPAGIALPGFAVDLPYQNIVLGILVFLIQQHLQLYLYNDTAIIC